MDVPATKQALCAILAQFSSFRPKGFVKFKEGGAFYLSVVVEPQAGSTKEQVEQLRTRITNFVTGRVLEELRPASFGVAVYTPQEFHNWKRDRAYEALD